MFFNKTAIKSNEERKQCSIKKIQKLGIDYLETLPLREESNQVKLKSLDKICKRAIACLISTQLACVVDANEDYEPARQLYYELLKKYNVQNSLIQTEKKLFNNNYSMQNVVDTVWTYEAYWALVWALGLIEDIESPEVVCDCQKAVHLVSKCKNYKDFKEKTKLRNIEEILDMLDLYYRYNWATTEKRINPETHIGSLNPDIVIERRKALEWLISKEKDWNLIPLDT